MASILESLSGMISPDMLGAVGKALGADPKAVEQAVGVAGPMLLGGLARTAVAPGGADALLKMLPQSAEGVFGSFGNLTSMVSGLTGAGGSGSVLNSLLGNGVNAVGASLSRQLGFNVTPVLGMVAPALLGVVSKYAKSSGVSASDLSASLVKESSDWAGNPSNSRQVGLINSALDAGKRASATIASYGADWDKVLTGPAAAVFLVTSADPSGPIGAVKEAKAAHAALIEGAGRTDPSSLIATAFSSGLTKEAFDILRKASPTRDRLLDSLKASIAAVTAHSPGEAQAYAALIQSVGNATANAAKDGGFLGIGGQTVSKDEQKALDAIKAALA